MTGKKEPQKSDEKTEEEPTPRQPSAPKQPKPTKVGINPFWLDGVFPNARDIFEVSCPPMSEMLTDCLFALDANVLLAPYLVEPNSFTNIEKIYNTLAKKNRLFVPSQAAREYGKHRGQKVADVSKKITDRLSALPDTNQLSCPILEGIAEFEAVKQAIDELRDKARVCRDSLTKLKAVFSSWGWRDKVSSLYREIFVPERICDHKRNPDDVLNQLKYRYLHEIPPGYLDSDKLDGGIGDLLIWFSLIELGKSQQKPVVFVTNEKKTDWFVANGKETVIARSELVLEFQRETGQRYGMMDWKQFLECQHADPQTVNDADQASQMSSVREISSGQREIVHLLLPIFNILAQFAASWQADGPTQEREPYIRDAAFWTYVASFRSAFQSMPIGVGNQTAYGHLCELMAILDTISAANKDAIWESDQGLSRPRDEKTLLHACSRFIRIFSEYRRGVRRQSV